MGNVLRKEILSETYEDMKKLIFKVSWEIKASHGGEINDLIGQANLLFIYALDEYDETESGLSTWLRRYIRAGLKNYIRSEQRHKSRHVQISIDSIDVNLQVFDSFSLMELLDEMGEDALTIVQLLFETPNDILLTALKSGKRMNHMKSYMRRRLRNRLRQWGWTACRITKTFGEMRKVISH